MGYYEVLSEVWAKSGRNGKPGESILVHTRKVITSLWGLAARHREYAEERIWSNIFWACFLHDFGKAAEPFQQSLRRLRPRWPHRHEVLSIPFVSRVVSPCTPDYRWILAAVASHHIKPKRLFSSKYYSLALDEMDFYNDLAASIPIERITALNEWMDEEWREWQLRFNEINISLYPPSPLSDWSFSGEAVYKGLKEYFLTYKTINKKPADSEESRLGIIMRGALQFSDHLGSAGYEVGFLALPDSGELREKALPEGANWHTHQEKCASINGNVVLAAPTGSGKTEAGFLWTFQQTRQRKGKGILVYLLPFQASMNAMKKRLTETLGAEVALLHSRALQALYRELTETGEKTTEAEKTAKHLNELGRLYRQPVWVASPYQLLKTAFKLPGYEILCAVLLGATIILDEVHAYEPDRLGMILELHKELVKNLGCRVMVMTATMPSWLRELWQNNLGAPLILPDRELYKKEVRHRINILDGDLKTTKTLKIIHGNFSKGKSVLVAVNSIKAAQETYSELQKKYNKEDLVLLHGRLNTRDRLAREKELEDRVGFKNRGRPCIAIATQVVEVSLNLDFETIITEPAPLEALLQRFGRVNRRGKKGIVPVYILTCQSGDYDIYDRRLVKNTLEILIRNDGEIIAEDAVIDWLDWIYEQDGLKAEWLAKVEESRRNFRRYCLDTLHPFNEDKDLERDFERMFDGMDVLSSSLLEEYDRLAGQSLIEAHSLLVSINRRRFFAQQCRWDEKRKVWLTEARYDPLLGLI